MIEKRYESGRGPKENSGSCSLDPMVRQSSRQLSVRVVPALFRAVNRLCERDGITLTAFVTACVWFEVRRRAPACHDCQPGAATPALNQHGDCATCDGLGVVLPNAEVSESSPAKENL